ncbi:MAG: hypothetical protein ACXVX0_20640 [Blastococcus sp.]
MLGTAGAGTDEERWAQAESILANNPTPSAEARIRRVRTMLWLFVVGMLVLGLAVGVLAVVLFGHGRHRASSVPAWQEITGLAVQLTGTVIEIVGIVTLRRRRQWGTRWRAPTAVLTRAQRRSLVRQVRGRIPAEPARLPLTRDLAGRLVDQRGLLVLYVGIAIVNVGQTIVHPTAFRVGLTVVVLVVYGVVIPLMRREQRRARRFLAEHPE